MKSNQIKSNQIKSNEIKSNQIKSNEIKSNQIKSNNLYIYTLLQTLQKLIAYFCITYNMWLIT